MPGLSSAMAGNYRQDEQGFYYADSTNYNPAGYEFSASTNQFPVDPYVTRILICIKGCLL